MKNKIVSTIKTSAGELQLSEDALCKHTIFIGSTGSGKTTSLNVLLRDIIGYNAEDETQKVGLLVFDLKGDNTFFKIRKWAEEFIREEDVIDYCADSKFYFDPLGGLDSFRKIPEYVERLYNIFPFQSSEVYWEQSLRKRFKTVLTYCLFRHGKTTFKLFLDELREFTTADSSNSNWREVMDSVEMVLRALEKKSKGISIESYEVLRELLEDTRASVNEWQRLDPRTKNNELSTMSNLISSFGNPITNGHIFEGKSKTRLDVGELRRNFQQAFSIGNLQAFEERCLRTHSGAETSKPACWYCNGRIPTCGNRWRKHFRRWLQYADNPLKARFCDCGNARACRA